jgi:CxxC motif-containing protein (DUF1111 family)
MAGLDEGQVGRFLLGRAVFERLATEEEGLGPLFNAPRCSDCHEVPAIGGISHRAVVKATRWEGGRCDPLTEQGGDNVQQFATPLLLALGLGPELVPPEATHVSNVMATPLFGLGLLEAIPQEAIAALADPDDRDGDGISGRMGTTAEGSPGRFGRKADFALLHDFVDHALRVELGFTTPDHPWEERVNGVEIPAGADPMGEPEIDERGVALLTEYVRYLAPPPRRIPADPLEAQAIAAGEELFRAVGCVGCHVPEMHTGPHPVEALSRVAVPLYSDLLLHDLGEEMEGVCATGASPSEHRTAPLWGLGGRPIFLHDGRAASIAAAIAFHGGEAAAARAAFAALSQEERVQLLAFLASL